MDQTSAPTLHQKPEAKWGPVSAVLVATVVFLVSQLIGGLLISLYGVTQHWSQAVLSNKLKNSITVQFWYLLLTSVLMLGLLAVFLRWRKAHPKDLGLKKPVWRDLGMALIGYGFYFVVYIIIVTIIHNLVPSFDINQKQELGFNTGVAGGALILTAISLVILPPITEEILFRGFLFTGLRSKMRFIPAALITSVLFAVPHLLEAKGALLWIGGLDTLVLSMVLCYLREKTGSLWASMGVHMIKNGLAFASLFIFHVV